MPIKINDCSRCQAHPNVYVRPSEEKIEMILYCPNCLTREAFGTTLIQAAEDWNSMNWGNGLNGRDQK